MAKVEVPSRRAKLPSELENELESALAGADLQSMLIGDALLQVGRELEEGQRLQGKVLKVHGEYVFFTLGGHNEGVVSLLQFQENPEVGTILEVIVRGYLADEGMYELSLPGGAISVSDWEDLKEGEVVEARVTGANTGGLECTVGQTRGFIPASQVAEYRVEDLTEFVDQKVLCVITQSNPARGNLVLSRRAVLEREKAEKRQQRLAEIEIGGTVEGVVRKLMDFGAFIDIGGLDGLLHISQLSWERVKHPSEVLEEGQKIQVRVDKVDENTGKISLSYRALQDHPWTNIEARFPAGAIVKGTVTRIAEFGAFVRLATGIEGLVHLSELANYRVHRVANHVKEGQEVEVKVLSVEADKQRISLSLKAAQQPTATEQPAQAEAEVEEPPRELALPKHRGPLKGGLGRGSGGDQFGLKW
jgi:ribosomal protein S1